MIGFISYKTDGLFLREIVGIVIIERHKDRQMETQREK